MGLIVVVLAIIPVGNNKSVLIKVIAEVWKLATSLKYANGARNTSG